MQMSRSYDLESPQVQDADALGTNLLSVAVIGPEERRRAALAAALAGPLCGVRREFPFYPDLEQLQKMLDQNFDLVIVDLDSNPETALDLVENICAESSATVMVYSAQVDSELMIRCMRAGAREFLTEPFDQSKIAESLVRASARRAALRVTKKADGRVSVFWGAKGGSGVTTLASIFALWLARESGKKTLLIDLDLPLGDVSLALGVSAQYSTVDALLNFHRLDSNFLSRLRVEHDSGLSVLTAPGKLVKTGISKQAIDKLLSVARQDFDYVVVDSGSMLDLAETTLFDLDADFYLVTLVSIPDLRNSNRLITEFFASEGRKLSIVLNRYVRGSMGVDDEHITKALTRPVQWRIPEDSAADQKIQGTAAMLSQDDSPVCTMVRQMARTVCGLTPLPEKKKRKLGLF